VTALLAPRRACRTLDEVREAGRAAAREMPPLTQDQADLVAAILAPYQDGRPARHRVAQGGRQHYQAAGMPAGRVAGVKTYTVRAKRWARGWELHIDGLCVTQSHALRDAEMMARDYIELDTGAQPGSFDVAITPEIGDGLDGLAREAREAVTAADRAQRDAAARSREVARRLRDAGLNGRDIARVLDVSLPPAVVVALADAITPRYRVGVVLAAGAGLRFGEATGLTVPRVGFLPRRIQVLEQVQNRALAPLKTSASMRTIPAGDWTLDEVTAHLQRYGPGPDQVIMTNSAGRFVQRNSFGDCWRRAVKVARTCGKPPADRSGQRRRERAERCADPAHCAPEGTHFHDLSISTRRR
jgi:integrase